MIKALESRDLGFTGDADLDEWLKSINEEIESEDVTRFKVRFLEILRSILEWVRDRLESWLESSGEDQNKYLFDISEIVCGIFVLKIKTDYSVYSKKFILTR